MCLAVRVLNFPTKCCTTCEYTQNCLNIYTKHLKLVKPNVHAVRLLRTTPAEEHHTVYYLRQFLHYLTLLMRNPSRVILSGRRSWMLSRWTRGPLL